VLEGALFLEESLDGGGEGIELDWFFEELGSRPGLVEQGEQGGALVVEVLEEACEQDDGDVAGGGVALEFLGEDEAGGVGLHHDVEDDEVGGEGGEQEFGFVGGGSGGDAVTASGEEGVDGSGQVAVIVDEEDVGVHGGLLGEW
jgi:hypothetical protein